MSHTCLLACMTVPVICALYMYRTGARLARFCLSLQKKFLRVRLASDDEEEEGESVGVSGEVGGGEVGATRQTKEMEEVRSLLHFLLSCND